MSRLVRLIPPVIRSRRSYSFFSSKPGGGRYFNSTKPPKVLSQKNGRTSKTPTKTSTVSDAQEADTAVSTQAVEGYTSVLSSSSSHPSTPTSPLRQHPVLNKHEFQLHQFFALYRPMLLLNRPTSTLFESYLTNSSTSHSSLSIDDPPEASPEADAETARQLSRSLVINRVGSTMDWEKTLQILGCHQLERDLPSGIDDTGKHLSSSIALDSTKRKRRKMMKKHKLKKRRRLLRNSQSRLGK